LITAIAMQWYLLELGIVFILNLLRNSPVPPKSIVSGHVGNEKRLSLWPKVDKSLRIRHRHHPLRKAKTDRFRSVSLLAPRRPSAQSRVTAQRPLIVSALKHRVPDLYPPPVAGRFTK
jgi:hypothetical protein